MDQSDIQSSASSQANAEKRSLNRLIVILGCLLFGLVGLLALFQTGVIGGNQALLTIVNESPLDLRELAVTAAGKTYPLGELKAGMQKAVLARDLRDSAWQIHGYWENGEPLDLKVGYLTHGMNFRDHLVMHTQEDFKFESESGIIP